MLQSLTNQEADDLMGGGRNGVWQRQLLQKSMIDLSIHSSQEIGIGSLHANAAEDCCKSK